MSSEHRRPLAAFVVVAMLCAVLLGLAVVRSHAVLNLGNLPLVVAPPAHFDLFGPQQTAVPDEADRADEPVPADGEEPAVVVAAAPATPVPATSVPATSAPAVQVAGAAGSGHGHGVAPAGGGTAHPAAPAAPTPQQVATPVAGTPVVVARTTKARGNGAAAPGRARSVEARQGRPRGDAPGQHRGRKHRSGKDTTSDDHVVSARTHPAASSAEGPGQSAAAHAAAPGQAKKSD